MKNAGEEAPLSCLLPTCGRLFNGHLGPNRSVVQTINRALRWQPLCTCSLCATPSPARCSDPVWDQLAGNWWIWVMSWAAPELTVANAALSTKSHSPSAHPLVIHLQAVCLLRHNHHLLAERYETQTGIVQEGNKVSDGYIINDSYKDS